jgi:hypothetical protein
MRVTQERSVLSVVRHNGGWAVELDGEHFAPSSDKEVCKAAANRRAREIQDGGKACQVRVVGEHGFFGAV